MLALQVQFRGRGWQWPFGERDALVLYDGLQIVAELSGEILRALVVLYVETRAVRRPLARMPARALTASPTRPRSRSGSGRSPGLDSPRRPGLRPAPPTTSRAPGSGRRR